METCFVSGAQSMEQLQEGCEGTFGQAVGSLKHGFATRKAVHSLALTHFLFLHQAEIPLSQFIKVLHCRLNFDC